MKTRSVIVLMASALSLSGCNLAPQYVRPVSDVPMQWPSGAAYEPCADCASGLSWKGLFADAKLRQVVELALSSNQDLAAAVANLEAARGQYAAQRSSQLPSLTASASASFTRTVSGPNAAGASDLGAAASALVQPPNLYSASVGASSFELDLFGRQKNLSRQAFEQYLATQSGTRSTRLSLVSEVATSYITLASDLDLLTVARNQMISASRTVRLTASLHDAGLADGSDLAQAMTLLAQANSDVENFTARVAQDRNALELLVGRHLDDTLLPGSLDDLDPAIGKPSAGLDSQILLQRPDVVEAEHQLKGAYANIGAVRAAFFPSISLTTALGVISPTLSHLFSEGSTTWSGTPSISMPLLGGPNKGNLASARAQAAYAMATYRKAAQTAYREVADTLARQGTITRQRADQRDLVDAATKGFRISQARYRAGSDNFLNALVAQRTLYSAQQSEISAQLTDLTNRVALYRALGVDATL